MLTGCGGGGTNNAADELAILADRAERLAEHLEVGDGCAAEREGEELTSRARDALAAERISPEVASELLTVVEEVTGAVPCGDPQEPDEAPADEAPAEDELDEDQLEERREADEEADEEAREQDEDEETREEDEDEETPPGHSEEGPPGQREGAGRGRGNA